MALGLLVAACGGGGSGEDEGAGGDAGGGDGRARAFEAQVASYEVVAGRPQRVLVGLSTEEFEVVTGGEVEMEFRYTGTREQPETSATPGPTATGRFLPIPGKAGERAAGAPDEPRITKPSEGIGVYAAEVTLPKPGIWQVEVTAELPDGPSSAPATLEVLAEPKVPAPGEPAPRTQNPTYATPGADLRAIDSRAEAGMPPGELPAPGLHDAVIAEVIAAGKPLVVVVSTPVFCQSQFCGPITDEVASLADEAGDDVELVHLEVWQDFATKKLNPWAKEWIFPDGASDAREPWVFTVGADGIIKQRFDNIVSTAELENAVAALKS